MVIYTTKDNDVLDHICWKYYGTSDAVHQVLQANPHLVKSRPFHKILNNSFC
ncbi:hypothetical protein FACS1894122_04620 [Alphaproteobacteria bacterium]|nr:hypothetical protein FACS1894122_04620 [Alphaproteobacteria bacterium]